MQPAARPVAADAGQHQELLPRPRRRSSGRSPSRCCSSSSSARSSVGNSRPRSTSAGSTRTGRPPSAQLRAAFAQVSLLELKDETQDAGAGQMQDGQARRGHRRAAGPRGGDSAGRDAPAGGPFQLIVYTDPSQQTASSTVQQVVQPGRRRHQPAAQRQAAGAGRDHPAAAVQDLTNAAYFVPSILAMALMQLGIFAPIPLVGQREKLILKRLNATPLSRARWSLERPHCGCSSPSSRR